MDRLAILVPVLERPGNVQPLLDSIAATTPDPYRVLFIADPHDVPEHDAIRAAGGEFITVDGNYAAKINVGVRATDEPYIFMGADDLRFHPKWLERAMTKMRGKVGVVGTNDMGNPRVVSGDHSTHSLVARWYADLGTIDDPTKVLHEGYLHEFVDDEFVETAKSRGAFISARDSHVEHLHPMWDKAPTDHLYQAQQTRMRAGRRVFRQRCKLWR